MLVLVDASVWSLALRRQTHDLNAEVQRVITELRHLMPTYTAKRGRRYRYYVCQAARQNGWDSCPAKSLSAGRIEDSVVAQLRVVLRLEETRQQLHISDADWQVFKEVDPGALVRAVVEKIGYDGTTGAVSVKLGIPGDQS